MPIAVKFDGQAAAAAYSRAFRRLAQLQGFSQHEILRAEAGSILKRWAGLTKVATPAQADARTRLRVVRGLGYTRAPDRGDVTVNAGIRGPYGRVWIKAREGRGRRGYLLAMGPNFTQPTGKAVFNKFSPTSGAATRKWVANVNDAVADVQAGVGRQIPIGRRAIGMSRQSVVQIADKLGIDLLAVRGQGVSPSGVIKARAAIASNGRAYQNGVGYQGGERDKAYIDLINRLPYGPKIGMDRTLARVLATRAKFIETSYEKGAFDSMRNAARSFPNLIRFTG